jgi:hypothetical protein
MKLSLNEKQRDLLLEILRASENNAVNGADQELAVAFNDLYKKIEPLNCTYINLNRSEAEIIVEFCGFVEQSLDKALKFLDQDKERSADEVGDLKEKTQSMLDQITSVSNQIQEKIRQHPVSTSDVV